MTPPPLHLVAAGPEHGVTRFAHQVAEAVGAPVGGLLETMRLDPRPVHVHVTDRLFGDTAEEATRRLTALARRHPLTVTLHDVPQPGDGAVFARRVATYAAVLELAQGWVVSSHHEADLVRRHLRPRTAGRVVPLPVLPMSRTSGRADRDRREHEPATVALLGWVYPGKGHAEVLRACARLDRPVTVVALGRVALGHETLHAELDDLARQHGVGLEVTGWIPEETLRASLAAVDVPVAAHRNVSASGSINSWLAAGRRPVVVAGSYTDEMARLRPGTLLVADDAGEALVRTLAQALDRPQETWLAPGTALNPDLGDVARAYRRFWSVVWEAAP